MHRKADIRLLSAGFAAALALAACAPAQAAKPGLATLPAPAPQPAPTPGLVTLPAPAPQPAPTPPPSMKPAPLPAPAPAPQPAPQPAPRVVPPMAPAACDSISSGGWVLKVTGDWASFSADAGCKKNGDLRGNVDYVDHEFDFHLRSTEITAYAVDPANPRARDICGRGRVNNSPIEVRFRVHLEDNGEPGNRDRFGIVIDHWCPPAPIVIDRQCAPDPLYVMTSRATGGNVQLHPEPGNKGTVPREADCDGLPSP